MDKFLEMTSKTKTTDTRQTLSNSWSECSIGITGANGSLGRALTHHFRNKGAFIIGITHRSINTKPDSEKGPHEWVNWQCGEEEKLSGTLKRIDILILNHGINPKASQSTDDLNRALEINALSMWRLIEQFHNISLKKAQNPIPKEVWVNTSEAEIQPALSPGYEISKKLIGELVSIHKNNLSKEERKKIKIRKLILGPFKSELNPIGIMSSNFVADKIIKQADLGLDLIIVTPNPLTYLIMPIVELSRSFYSSLVKLMF